jgi:hypothetical protein
MIAKKSLPDPTRSTRKCSASPPIGGTNGAFHACRVPLTRSSVK